MTTSGTGADPAGASEDASPKAVTWPSWLSTLATFGSPLAVATALLLYFGWVRADAQARELGYDVALLRYSTSDYVLRSVNVLFFPLIALLVSALAALWAHRRIKALLSNTPRRRVRNMSLTWATWAWMWLPAALGLAVGMWSSAAFTAALPFLLTAGLLASVYARVLRADVGEAPAPNRSWVALVSGLLVVLLFWDVQRIASAFGTEYAQYVKANPSIFPRIALLSEKPLNLNEYDLQLTDAGPDVSHRYRYEGLWLMNYANQRYILLARTASDGRTAVVVLPDLPNVQLAFEPTR